MTRSLRWPMACAIALLLPSPASSDEWLSGKAPFDWTGFYLGAHLGGLANLGDISDPLGGSLFGNPNRATGGFAGAQIEAMLSYDVTERLSLGIGARYWAMWTTDASMTRSFDASGPVTPLRQHLKIETERAGIFGQALYRFD